MFALEEDTNEGHEVKITDWSEATVELPKLMQKLTDALNENRHSNAIDFALFMQKNLSELITFCFDKVVKNG